MHAFSGNNLNTLPDVGLENEIAKVVVPLSSSGATEAGTV